MPSSETEKIKKNSFEKNDKVFTSCVCLEAEDIHVSAVAGLQSRESAVGLGETRYPSTKYYVGVRRCERERWGLNSSDMSRVRA